MEGKKIRIAINGFGRIGRAFYKVAREHQNLEVVAVNDLGDIDTMAYLLKYDTAYGRSGYALEVVKGGEGEESAIVVDGHKVIVVSQKDPTKLPWGAMNIDIVVESTGLFTSYEKAKAHLDAGAKKVVVSAPMKGPQVEGVVGATVLMGVNEDVLNSCQISSNASCTTNASSPVISILNETIGIEKAILNTTHAYTASQRIVDLPSGKDLREGRAAAMNMIPASTGAAIAVGEVISDLKGKFDGISVRVPVITGSLADVTFIAKRGTSVEEVNNILVDAAKQERWQGIFTTTDEPIVSSDIVGDPHASIADLAMTRVVDGNLVKVLAWYDNEMGYTHSLVRHVLKTAQSLA